MNTSKKPVIFLMGPTASGKTKLSLALAHRLPIEIISVDSAMIYRYMDIGTGKPSATELALVPHHLINILDPSQSYSAAQFCDAAIKLITDIHQHQKIPLLVGGTMLYFKALKYGMADLPGGDITLRQRLEIERKTLGLDKLHQRLAKIDPLTAKKIHPHDPQRLLRALEVYEISGIPLSQQMHNVAGIIDNYSLLQIAIAPENRPILHQHIATRFKQMLANGLVAEVKALYQRSDLHKDLPAMRCVGYRQIWQYLAGEISYEQMEINAIVATRQLAKRQLTWLRAWENLHWFNSEDEKLLENVLNYLL